MAANSSVVFGVRLLQSDFEILQFLAATTCRTRSAVVRHLLRLAVLQGDSLSLAPNQVPEAPDRQAT